MWGFILYSSFLILHSQLDRGLAHEVADVFHQFLMVMVGAAACTAHHAHRATFPLIPKLNSCSSMRSSKSKRRSESF